MNIGNPKLQEPTVPLGDAAEAESGSWLTIDLGAIAANWRLLNGRVSPAECAAVVKSDAYGCGIEAVTKALARAGCKTFFVADLAEARRVRAIAPEAVIYVLKGLMPETASSYAELRVQPVINSLVELAEWDAFVSTSKWNGGAALHVDTGMNRLGIGVEEAAALSPRAQTENHGITLLMSHLAAADVPEHPLNDQQIRAFREIRMMFRGISASLANSSGIFLGPAAYADLVRPGVALYGGNPTPGQPNPMRPVIELKGRILQIREVKRGDTVGYGATWTAKRTTRLAIISVGYADGYLHAASAANELRGGEIVVAGQLCPLAGRISMDLIAADITDLEGIARRGDIVSLIGGAIGIDELAKYAGTISYEILTSVGRRGNRIYRDETD